MLLLAWLSACMGGEIQYAVPDPVFREMMDYEIAQGIAGGCEKMSVNVSSNDHKVRLTKLLEGYGISKEQARAKLHSARFERGDAYKRAYLNVIPVRSQGSCAIGDYEISRASAVGNLLVAQ